LNSFSYYLIFII